MEQVPRAIAELQMRVVRHSALVTFLAAIDSKAYPEIFRAFWRMPGSLPITDYQLHSMLIRIEDQLRIQQVWFHPSDQQGREYPRIHQSLHGFVLWIWNFYFYSYFFFSPRVISRADTISACLFILYIKKMIKYLPAFVRPSAAYTFSLGCSPFST